MARAPKSGCAAHDDPCANACVDRHQAAPAKMSTLEVGRREKERKAKIKAKAKKENKMKEGLVRVRREG